MEANCMVLNGLTYSEYLANHLHWVDGGSQPQD
ncbi:hypothetical protein SBA7_590003 [Candidatus Sulfotelmatobacter sp. SbA7]|nr:hypothetical protein SBA7_590003 [Candidatus Sulfotelmatobacter sp. SbA7]